MIEVLSSYKCSQQTFFLAVAIMDQFYAKSSISQQVTDLHLIGVSSMFIACKYEEIYPIKLSVIYEKIAHKKIPIDAIKAKEGEILQTLDFKLVFNTTFDITNFILEEMKLDSSLNLYHNFNKEKYCIPQENINILIKTNIN